MPSNTTQTGIPQVHTVNNRHTHAHTPWTREGSVKYKCSHIGWLEYKCLYFLRSSDTAQSMCTERHSPCYHQRWTGWRFWEALWGDQGVTQSKRSVCVSVCVCMIIDICPGPIELNGNKINNLGSITNGYKKKKKTLSNLKCFSFNVI